jgi:hypothetical protein
MSVTPLVVALFLVGQADTKVEEVSFDDLEKDEKPAMMAPGERVEEVKLEDIARDGASPEYDRRPWLRVLPLFALLIVVWNVDWRELRAKAEIAARRAKKAPPVRKKDS